MSKPNRDTVWITGLALATPLGATFRDFSDRVLAGQSGIRAITSFTTKDHACKIAGLLNAEHGSQKWEALLLTCATQALKDAGWWERRLDTRIGLVLGLGAEWQLTWDNDMQQGGNRCVTPDGDGEGYTPTLHQQLQLRGPSSTVSAACASGNLALGVARQWIRQGWVDVVLAGSVERPITPLALAGFSNLGALSTRNDRPTAASRPFDRERDGFVMGEGGAMFVLESSASARTRGAKVYGEIAGFGASSDAFHLVSPSEDPRHAAHAIRQALQDAELAPEDLHYINAHATGTPIGDVFETKALHDALGEAVMTIPVSGTKSMTGHLIGAASAIEAVVCLTAFEHQAVPPTINLDDPDPECRLCHIQHQSQPRRVDVALSNSFGFGGSNTCLVLRRVA
jgi:3-oxoacyl-[acyl-carrier-protein] synthase II